MDVQVTFNEETVGCLQITYHIWHYFWIIIHFFKIRFMC